MASLQPLIGDHNINALLQELHEDKLNVTGVARAVEKQASAAKVPVNNLTASLSKKDSVKVKAAPVVNASTLNLTKPIVAPLTVPPLPFNPALN